MSEGPERDHALHLYDDDTTLATTVATFLAPGFARDDAIVSIGTRAHVAAIEQRLRSEGVRVDDAVLSGRYVSMDAERVIARLLRNGLPTRETFADVVGHRIEQLASRHGSVRAFGEIVSLLWRDGKQTAALRLEDLWNEALGYQPLSLVCGYATRTVGTEAAPAVQRIAKAHTRIIRPDA
ncbi:MAG TPA: MEDS domain-containing protein [Candidatus Limnocylindria bacterium]